MTTELFHSAKLKVKRANQHIGELNEMLQAFANSDFCRFFIEHDVDTGNYILKFAMTALPEMFPVIVGETLNNLRSALDLMMWELVTRCGGTPNKKTGFPVSETRKKLKNAIREGEIETVGYKVLRLIFKVIKPYKGGDDSLWSLHCLNNIDKHRLLITTASGGIVKQLTILPNHILFEECTFFVNDGGVGGVISMPHEFEFHINGQTVLKVVFNEREVIELESVIPTLHSLSQLIARIIQDVERTYLARS